MEKDRTLPRRSVLSALLCAPALAAIAPAQAQARHPVVLRVEAFLQSLNSLRGEFVQSVYLPSLSVPKVHRGVFYLLKPRFVRWEYQAPFEDLFLVDGKSIWIYSPELQQATVYKIEDHANLGAFGILMAYQENRPDIRFLESAEGLDWVSVVPTHRTNEARRFQAIKLGVGPQGIAAIDTTESTGVRNVFRFRGVVANEQLSRDLFVFKSPPGISVIHHN